MGLKMLFVTGLATGYLLGTKAGRRKYEQIKAKAAEAWEDPRVHKVVSDAQDFVKDAAPVVRAKVSDATAAASDGAASLRERIMEAVDSVLEKVTQGDEASEHATPPVGSAERPATGPASAPRPSTERPSAEHRPTEHPGESSPSPL